MAVVTTRTDDLDGSTDAQIVKFSYAGVAYEIDLGKANQKKLEDALSPFMEAATQVQRGFATAPATGEQSVIRKWAKEQGLEINERGAIPQHIKDKYANRAQETT